MEKFSGTNALTILTEFTELKEKRILSGLYFSECVPEEKRKPGVYASDLLTGKEFWLYETTSSPMSFSVSNGKVFYGKIQPAGNLVWRIVALNADNGAKIWERFTWGSDWSLLR